MLRNFTVLISHSFYIKLNSHKCSLCEFSHIFFCKLFKNSPSFYWDFCLIELEELLSTLHRWLPRCFVKFVLYLFILSTVSWNAILFLKILLLIDWLIYSLMLVVPLLRNPYVTKCSKDLPSFLNFTHFVVKIWAYSNNFLFWIFVFFW